MSKQESDNPTVEPEEKPFRYTFTQGLGELFEQLDISLLVSTYQAGKLCVFRSRSGRIKMLPRTFKKAMGVAANHNKIAVATQDQIWTLNNEPIIADKLSKDENYDACYLPRRSHITSNIDLHEIAWGREEELWLVNTLFSCLATLNDDYSFVPRWHPPFITQLARHDRCHMNGLAMLNGKPAYVSMFAPTDTPQGWREHKLNGGLVMDVASNEVVCSGLSMPHSPRIYNGRLWVLDSGNASLVCVDITTGAKEVVTKFEGYPRGLAFCGRYAFVGLSQIREKEIFSGIPIAADSKRRLCGVSVVDLSGGTIVGQLEFEKTVEEIFDVQILIGIRFPTIVGFDQDTLEKAASIGVFQALPASAKKTLRQSDRSAADQKVSLGLKCLKQGNLKQALSHFKKAVDLAPDYAKALNNLGHTLLQLEQIGEAIKFFRQAVRFDPEHYMAHNNLGNALRASGENESACIHYRRAIALKPDYASAQYNLGIVLGRMRQTLAAANALQRAIDIQPDLSVAWNDLGIIRRQQGEFEIALQCHDQATRLSPDITQFLMDKGQTLMKANRLPEAREQYENALVFESDNQDIHTDLALVLLKLGNYKKGWRYHECRFNVDRENPVRLTANGTQVPIVELEGVDSKNTFFPQTKWDGTPLNDRSILIWGEQGIGDEFMFASMFAEVIKHTRRCIIECDHRSVALFSRSFPDAQIVRRTYPAQPETQLRDIDFQCAMGSMGLWLRSYEKSFKHTQTGYLVPDQEQSRKFRSRYLTQGKNYVVGISWRTANLASANERNAGLEFWSGLLIQNNVQFVSLQYGDSSTELKWVSDSIGVNVKQDADVDSIADLDIFATQVSAMDLVISIDNSTAHLAGALGVPVWTLLPFSADWRWMLDRPDTPWYPNMRLYRQPTFGDWQSAFDLVAQDFYKFIGIDPEDALPIPAQSDMQANERAREKQKYEEVWNHDAYRDFSPGLESGRKFQVGEKFKDYDVKSILDVGCGSGKLMQWLMTEYLDLFEVNGFDISENCLDPWFDEKKEAVLNIGCIWEPQDFKQSYDAIICTDVLEHVSTEHIPQVLANFKQFSNKVCFFSIALFKDHFGEVLVNEPLHLTVKSPEWWRQKLDDAGLKIVWEKIETSPTGTPGWFHVFAIP